METLETKFNENLEQWTEHCKNMIHHSMTVPYLNCEAYRNIVAMGKEVLPLIRKVYDKDTSNDVGLEILRGLLAHPVMKIVGEEEFKIPEEIMGKRSAIEAYTTKWLDENI